MQHTQIHSTNNTVRKKTACLIIQSLSLLEIRNVIPCPKLPFRAPLLLFGLHDEKLDCKQSYTDNPKGFLGVLHGTRPTPD